MSSSRTHVSYLSPPLNSEPAPRKLKKEERDRDRGGNVLPRTGYQTAAASKMQSVGGGLRLEPGSSRHHHLLAPKLSTTIANAKERRKPHRHGEVSGASQTFTDEHGVTHDSECEELASNFQVLLLLTLLNTLFRRPIPHRHASPCPLPTGAKPGRR